MRKLNNHSHFHSANELTYKPYFYLAFHLHFYFWRLRARVTTELSKYQD